MFCGWAPAWMHRFLTRSRPTALRADRTSLAPCLDSCTARASPIPLDAPEKNWVFERRKFLWKKKYEKSVPPNHAVYISQTPSEKITDH